MLTNNKINKIVKIKKSYRKLDSELNYYSNKQGIVKGIKTLPQHISVYLIEFINYNRIWALEEEVEFS